MMIETIVAALAIKLARNESVKSFLSEFTQETVNWIKPIFLHPDESEKEVLQQLKAKPNSKARKKALTTAIEIGVEDTPEAKKFLKEMFDKISFKNEGIQKINSRNITNSERANSGDVDTGGGHFLIK